jgi:hypothetical protein
MRHERPAATRRLVALVALVAALAGCGGTPTGSATPTGEPSPQPSGDAEASGPVAIADLCTLLSPTDFARFGVDGAGEPEATTDGTGSTYCVYAGESGATGGIELDLFPNPDESTAHDTFVTATGETAAGRAATGGGFDESSFAIDDDVALLVVRQGPLVIALAAPNDVNTEQGLVSLAQLALERADPVLLGRP